MRSGYSSRAALAAVLVFGLIAGVPAPFVTADEVSDQERRVAQIADDLDALENQLGQLEEDHAAALDRIDELGSEITLAQGSVDAQQAVLARLQAQMVGIALDRFTSGGDEALTPLFSSVETLSDDLQRTELSRVALDQGAGTTDDLVSLVDDLTVEQRALEAKQSEQAGLIAGLEEKQVRGEQLTAELTTKYGAAQAELGDLVAEERERRIAAALASAQEREARSRSSTGVRSSGAASSGSSGSSSATVRGGGTQSPVSGSPIGGSGAATPAEPAAVPAPDVPAPSSMSGVAVNAAQGQLGVAYKFAASSPGVAFDCSGLTKYAWGKAGVSLPHQSSAQFASTPHVPADQAQPGDLIFYYAPIGHVAIYLGGGSMVHAPATGDVVKVSVVNWAKVVGVSRPG